jgi:ketosteroid isomerase-like protein
MAGPSATAEVVRRYYEARKCGDDAGAIGLLDPDAEFDLSESESPYRGIYRGTAEIEKVWSAMNDSWSENWVEIEGELVVDNRVVVRVTHHTRGRSSGIQAAARGAQILTVRDNRIVALKLFQSWGEAVAAVAASRG